MGELRLCSSEHLQKSQKFLKILPRLKKLVKLISDNRNYEGGVIGLPG